MTNSSSHRAFFVLFAVRFVLEVLGSGGAVWGCTEAIGIRTTDNHEWWRYCAQAATIVFFVRWMHQMLLLLFLQTTTTTTTIIDDGNDDTICIIQKKRKDNSTDDDDSSYSVLVIRAFTTFLLEVMGATGAIWGFSIVVNLHTVGVNDNFWRPMALMVGFIFLLQWINQQYNQLLFSYQNYYHQRIEHVVQIMEIEQEKQEEFIFVTRWTRKFILQVLGAGGAIWGFSDALGLHNNDDSSKQLMWRQRALVMSGIFFLRFVVQLKDAIIIQMQQKQVLTVTQWQRLGKKFVLDLCGCVGIVGGISMVQHYHHTNDDYDDDLSWWPYIYIVTTALLVLRFEHSYIQECSLSTELADAEQELRLEEEEESSYASILGSSATTNSRILVEETTPIWIRQKETGLAISKY